MILQAHGHSDEFMTPHYVVDVLTPYLSRTWAIWECAYGDGDMAQALQERGYNIIGNRNLDFLKRENVEERLCDCIVTNPPYSLKTEFLTTCYNIGKPFALLLPLTTLEGRDRRELFATYGISLIIPNKRVNFITPSGKGSGAWFQVAWFCWKLPVPQQLNFVKATW